MDLRMHFLHVVASYHRTISYKSVTILSTIEILCRLLTLTSLFPGRSVLNWRGNLTERAASCEEHAEDWQTLLSEHDCLK